jgi:hypothetical protein
MQVVQRASDRARGKQRLRSAILLELEIELLRLVVAGFRAGAAFERVGVAGPV